MPILRRTNPLNYALCNQTVTVYHQDPKTKVVTRTVYNHAFLEFKKTQNVDKTGSTESNSFLLVIPCKELEIVYVNGNLIINADYINTKYDGKNVAVISRFIESSYDGAGNLDIKIPKNSQRVFVGDKVLHGVGPDVVDWPKFIPATTPGLVVVRSVDQKFWNEKLVHIEAGG